MPPDEAGAAVAELVDSVEVGDEIGECRAIERRDEAGDVVLSKMPLVAHIRMIPQLSRLLLAGPVDVA